MELDLRWWGGGRGWLWNVGEKEELNELCGLQKEVGEAGP